MSIQFNVIFINVAKITSNTTVKMLQIIKTPVFLHQIIVRVPCPPIEKSETILHIVKKIMQLII